MKIALVQMEIKEKSRRENTARGLRLLEEAASQSNLVILPEIWSTGYSLGHLAEEAETLDGPLVNAMCGIARKYGCSLLPGSLPVKKDGKIYNMLLLADEISVLMGNADLRKMSNIQIVKTYLTEIYDKYHENV
jgi:predicted amidohydrolase